MSVCKNALVNGLFEQHGWNLFRFLCSRMRTQEAEDIAQQAYLHLLQHPDPAAITNPAAYLYRTASNLAIDNIRKENNRLRYTETDADLAELSAPLPEPEATLDTAARLEKFTVVLAELPAPCRHAFLLNKLDGLTHSEIAARLGLSKKTVQRYILKTLEHCAARLDP